MLLGHEARANRFSPRTRESTNQRKASEPDVVSEILVFFRVFSGPKKHPDHAIKAMVVL
jgi:hypothetical protein